jgi:hypothetical protein
MVVLLILLALAIDVGSIYRERRRMQNAADAAALAGARDICFGAGWNGSFDNEGHPARIEATAYALQNGAEEADVTIHGGGWCVTVLATEATETFFGGIIGMNTVDVHATATAACGEARRACGLWPIAFKHDRWWQLLQAALSAEYKCNVPFYVWAGDNPNQQPDCDVYECDVNGDGINDIVNQLQRAWLDFSDVTDPEYPDHCTQDGCGAAELVCYLESDSGASILIPACIGGDTGVKAGTKAAVNSRIGDTVAIPIFDTYCDGATCSGQDIHAIYFACIKILGWDHSLELPRKDGALPPWKGPVIAAKVDCTSECSTRCGGTIGGPPPAWGVKAVSLIE